jgi:hypothetical protein
MALSFNRREFLHATAAGVTAAAFAKVATAADPADPYLGLKMGIRTSTGTHEGAGTEVLGSVPESPADHQCPGSDSGA